jgi:hypothetical protein
MSQDRVASVESAPPRATKLTVLVASRMSNNRFERSRGRIFGEERRGVDDVDK